MTDLTADPDSDLSGNLIDDDDVDDGNLADDAGMEGNRVEGAWPCPCWSNWPSPSSTIPSPCSWRPRMAGAASPAMHVAPDDMGRIIGRRGAWPKPSVPSCGPAAREGVAGHGRHRRLMQSTMDIVD